MWMGEGGDPQFRKTSESDSLLSPLFSVFSSLLSSSLLSSLSSLLSSKTFFAAGRLRRGSFAPLPHVRQLARPRASGRPFSSFEEEQNTCIR